MTRLGYREFDYSGDVGVEAWGESPLRLLEQLTLGFLSLIATAHPEPTVERDVVVSAVGPSDLVVDWLSELILLSAVHGEVYSSVRIDSVDECHARGVVIGAALDENRHALRCEVKAVTYHGLLYERTKDGYHARIIFDL